MKRDQVTVWVVTPHHDQDYDECWLAAETDADHHAALKYAKDRLEDLWDDTAYDETLLVTVTMERRAVPADEFEAIQDGLQ